MQISSAVRYPVFPIRRQEYSGSGSSSGFRNLPSTKNYLLSSTTDKNVLTERNKQKNLQVILLASWKPLQKRTEGSGSVIQWYGSADPDPSQNIPVLEHFGIVPCTCWWRRWADSRDFWRCARSRDKYGRPRTGRSPPEPVPSGPSCTPSHCAPSCIWEKMEKLEIWIGKVFFYNDPKSFLFQWCIQQLILNFITDPNLFCSHCVSRANIR